MKKTKKFYMAGTEGTGDYIVLASTSRGRVGIRVLAGNSEKIGNIEAARIRVEPMADKPKVAKTMAGDLSGWKQPDCYQSRFSMVVSGKTITSSLKKALAAIGVGSLKKVEINDNAPKWAKSLVSKAA